MSGNGTSLDFGDQTAGGEYSIRAINGETGCENMMSGTVIITIIELPQIFNLSGGGPYCQGESGVDICLEGSTAGVEYELLMDDGPTGQILVGTGAQICFQDQTSEGVYSIMAMDLSTGCTTLMSGSVDVTLNMNPIAEAGIDQTIDFATTTYLEGQSDLPDEIAAYYWSPAYLLYDPELAFTQTVPLTATTYFTLNVENLETGCISQRDTVMVQIINGPLQVNIEATPQMICVGQGSELHAITSGGKGTYTYSWTSNPSGFSSNLQNPVVSPLVNTTYIALVSDGLSTQTDSILIMVNEGPEPFNVIGGGLVCTGDVGVEIGLSDSESGIHYELFMNDFSTNLIIPGTGNPITFGTFNKIGLYSVKATSMNSGCSESMNGFAEIVSNETPIAIAGDNQVIPSGSNAQLTCAGIGGTGSFEYFWEPEALLLDAFVKEPQTIALTESKIFTVNIYDTETSCSSNKDTTFVFVSGGHLRMDIFAENDVLCPNESTRIYCLPGGGTGNYYVQWSSNPPGFISHSYNPPVSPPATTTYRVSVHDGEQIIIDSITVQVNTAPIQFIVTGGGGICLNGEQTQEIQLDGSEVGITYELFLNDHATGRILNGTGGILVFDEIQEPGLYTIWAFNESCVNQMKGSARVYFFKSPIPYPVSGNPLHCTGASFAKLEVFGSHPDVMYELYLNDVSTGIQQAGTGYNLVFNNISDDGTYQVWGTNLSSGCSQLMNGSLTVNTYPSPQGVTVEDVTLCKGEEIILTATGGDYYTWQTTPPEFTSQVTVKPGHDTTIQVVIANEYGCADIEEVSIWVEENPDFEIEILDNKIWVYPAGFADYAFIYNDVTLQHGISNSFILPASLSMGDSIFIQVSNLAGCDSVRSIRIDIDRNANAFTPNQDGYNDIFLEGSEITVFDRWGIVLYEGTDGWDGTFNGKPMAAGTYFYIQKIKDTEGHAISTFKGTVLLIRD